MIRIEHKKDKVGIFAGNHGVDAHSNCEDILERHRQPEFPGYRSDDYINSRLTRDEVQEYNFAYKSIHQFCTALTQDEIKEFITLGFKIFYIEATDSVESDYQIVFKPNSVTKKQNITKLFK